jgi:hypothetical protein
MTLSWTQVNDGQAGPASYQLRYAQPPFDWATADVACDVAGTQIGDLSATESTVTLRWEQVSDALGYPPQYQV